MSTTPELPLVFWIALLAEYDCEAFDRSGECYRTRHEEAMPAPWRVTDCQRYAAVRFREARRHALNLCSPQEWKRVKDDAAEELRRHAWGSPELDELMCVCREHYRG